MRIRLLIPFAAVLALGACGERPTPKPSMPSAVTAPIEPGQAAPAADAAAPAAAVCPPQPALVCPPAVQVRKASTGTKATTVRKVVKTKVRAHHKAHHKGHHHKSSKTYAHRRHHEHGGMSRHEHAERHEHEYAERRGYHEDDRAYPPPRQGPGDYAADDHLHAYGQSGAVAHFARPHGHHGYREQDGYHAEDRYSGGSYQSREGYSYSRRTERREEGAYAGGYARSDRGGYRAEGGASYSERRSGSASSSSSYSERYEDRGGGYTRVDAGPGCCRPVEAAGRDANGFLTWPGKVPAAPY